MIMRFGMYKGLEVSALPEDYLRWIVANFDEGNEVKAEARRILNSELFRENRNSKSLEEQANELLGEKPIGLLKRGYGKPRKRNA